MLSLYLCYFTFGFCMSFGSIAMNFEMMESLQFTPVEMTMSYGVIAAPWCIKPIFGLISDTFQIADWGKRRPYIFICGILLSYLYTVLPKLIETKTSLVATMTTISFLMCFADVCADCITVDYAKKEKVKGRTQGNCWTSRALGSVIGSAFGGIIYESFGTKVVFQIMTVPCFLMALFIWKLRSNVIERPQNICKKLWKSVYKKRYLSFALFMISIGPNYSPFYTYFLRKELHFTPEDFQWITLSAAISFLVSTFVYKTYLLHVDPIILMCYSSIGGVMCQLIQLFVATKVCPSIWLIIFDTIGESLFGMWMIMPLIVAVAHHAKDGVEGTFYALLMAVSNLSGVLADEIGGLIGNMLGVTRENFDNMPILIIICALCDLAFQMMVVNNTSVASYFEVLSEHRGGKRGRRRNPARSANNKATLEIPEVNRATAENQEESQDPGYMPGTSGSPDHMQETSDSVEVDLGYTSDCEAHPHLDHTPATSVIDRVQQFAQSVMPPAPPAYRAVSDSDA